MHRFITVLSIAAIVSSALPALAGPNGGSPSFSPLPRHRAGVSHKVAPYALLGDSSTTRALPPGVMGKHPTRPFERRPSEGK
jgi:hypothetical protein